MRVDGRFRGFGFVLVAVAGCAGGEPAAETSPPIALPTVSTRPQGTVEERLVKAEALAKGGQRAKALETLEEALLIDHKDRKTLFLLAKLGREESIAVQKSDPAKAYRTMVSAGGYLRELGSTYPEATDEEKTLRREVLVDEANAHARSRRIEETGGALREAVGAGFRDFDRLKADPDWKEILAIPEFRTIFDEIVSSAK